MAKLSRTADFPIVAVGHNVYRRSESSPICTCVDMGMAVDIAERLNRSEGINDRRLAHGAADDLASGNHQF